MTDRETIIKEFKERISDCSLIGDGFDVTINWKLADDILALLEPIPVKHVDGKKNHFIKCGKCNIDLMSGFNFCPKCGHAVKWE